MALLVPLSSLDPLDSLTSVVVFESRLAFSGVLRELSKSIESWFDCQAISLLRFSIDRLVTEPDILCPLVKAESAQRFDVKTT